MNTLGARSTTNSSVPVGSIQTDFLSMIRVVVMFGIFGLGMNEAVGGGFAKAFNTVKSGLSFAGSIPGSFLGGFIGAATAPSISQAEQAGDNLVGKANKAMEERINQMDDNLKARLGQMDTILKIRIEDVGTVLSNRIGQVDTALAVRIDQVDSILGKHLAELDQITEKRIGNLDVVATKASLTLEESILRALAMGCLMVFFSFAVWLAYNEGVKAWPQIALQDKAIMAKLFELFRAMWPKVVGRLALAGAAVFLLWLGFVILPGGAKSRMANLAKAHLRALDRHLAAFDFGEAAYQSSQLKALDSTDSILTGARLKSELIRDIFSRPSAIQSQDGFLGVIERIKEIESYVGKDKDPDVQSLKGIILWRSAANKLFEHYAASCFASAIQQSPQQGFPLEALALSYLDIYLDAPVSRWVLDETHEATGKSVKVFAANAREIFGDSTTKFSVETMESVLDKWRRLHGLSTNSETIQIALQNGFSTPRALRPYLAYNSLVKELKRVTATGYTEMLTAYSKGAAEMFKATNAANAILDAWTHFNEELGSDVFTSAQNIRIAPLLLNDAFQDRAAFFVVGNVSWSTWLSATNNNFTNLTRVKLQPRLNSFLSGAGFSLKLVNWQETQRYCSYESETRTFEQKFVKYRKAVDSPKVGTPDRFKLAFEAAAAAAQLGLYDYRSRRPRPLSEMILLQEARIPEPELFTTFAREFEGVQVALQRRTIGVL